MPTNETNNSETNTDETRNQISVTYFQARGLPLTRARWYRRWLRRMIGRGQPTRTATRVAEALPALGFEEESLSDTYDVAAIDAKMFRRFIGKPLSFSWEKAEQLGITAEQPVVRILLTPTGHYVLSIKLEFLVPSSLNSEDVTDFLKGLALISQEQFGQSSECKPNSKSEWTLEQPLEPNRKWKAEPPTASESIRRAFDLLGFALHEALLGKQSSASQCSASDLQNWSQTWRQSEQRSKELHRNRELASPYISTWGYHAEFDGEPTANDSSGWKVHFGESDRWTGHAFSAMLSARNITLEDTAQIESTALNSMPTWVVSDVESIHMPTGSVGDCSSSDAVSLIEYLAYRRGIATAVQRDIADTSLHPAGIHRKQAARWIWTLATTTDDYVLARWRVGMLRQIRSAIHRDLDNWDLEHREEQARQRLAGVQEQLQIEQGRLTTLLAVIFGFFAFASLLPVLSFVFAWALDNPSVTDAPLELPLVFLGVAALLLAVLLTLSIWLVRKAERVRPSAPSRPSKGGN